MQTGRKDTVAARKFWQLLALQLVRRAHLSTCSRREHSNACFCCIESLQRKSVMHAFSLLHPALILCLMSFVLPAPSSPQPEDMQTLHADHQREVLTAHT
jgi:hypothetical protein